jgi:hypothetical protein
VFPSMKLGGHVYDTAAKEANPKDPEGNHQGLENEANEEGGSLTPSNTTTSRQRSPCVSHSRLRARPEARQTHAHRPEDLLHELISLILSNKVLS